MDGAEPLEGEVTPGEVVETVRRRKTGKQGGPDGVKPEFIEWAGEGAIKAIAEFFLQVVG
eukprot:12748344-Alexandrium_andersonii.AAC.1